MLVKLANWQELQVLMLGQWTQRRQPELAKALGKNINTSSNHSSVKRVVRMHRKDQDHYQPKRPNLGREGVVSALVI